MRRRGFLALRVSLFALLFASVGGLGAWLAYDWKTGWITFAALYVTTTISLLVGLQPTASRRYRWGRSGVSLAWVVVGVLLVVGVPDRPHEGIGFAFLTAAAMELWTRHSHWASPAVDRAKRVLFALFGGPDVGWFESTIAPDAAPKTAAAPLGRLPGPRD